MEVAVSSEGSRGFRRLFAGLFVLLPVVLVHGGVAWSERPAPGGRPAQASGSAFPQESDVAAPSAERILSDIRYLASPELAGRATGEPGCERAARYIASVFDSARLVPLGEERGYLQPFDAVVGTRVAEGNSLAASVRGRTVEYEPDVDFRPLSFSSSGSASGRAVFAGYGISAPKYGYDDYEQVDVDGCIVIVLRHEPREDDEDSPFGGASPTYYSDLRYKATNAREHGASGLVLVTDPLNHEGAEEELLEFDPQAGRAQAGMPCVQLTIRAAEELFAQAGLDLVRLQAQIDSTMSPHAVALDGISLHVHAAVERDVKRAYNVLGLLEGNDPGLRNEVIVVGAHCDHLGRDSTGVYCGADDNASGTAGVMEIARLLSSAVWKPSRSVLFAAFSGEELGLLGSSYLANALQAGGMSGPDGEPLRAACMLNMDMMGRLRERKLYVGGVGTSPLFRPLLETLGAQHGLELDYSEAGYGPSDHTPFYAKGAPVLFFFTGIHGDHHRTSDTWEKINAEGEADVVSFVLDVLRELADSGEIPFSRAEGQAEPPGGERYGGYGRARLGIVPDFGGGETAGVLISGASEGSPAERAGFMPGDVIVSFDGHAVRNLQDLTYFLRDKKPGDKVVVVVERGGKQIPLEVVLGERKGRGSRR